MARVLVIEPELMLASRVEGALRAAGHEPRVTGEVPTDPGDAELVLGDLGRADPDRLVSLGLPVVGFYAHVDVETRRRAEAAGVGIAVPRSKLFREIDVIVRSALAS